mmetsp:Transcript_5271/g.9708  ORF Transcript_5271/g.9708 Transcript_5271/m.9708 type:complete len:318 (+) Transcript_5271:6133-7086(+)
MLVPALIELLPPVSIIARSSERQPQSTPVEKSIRALSFAGRGHDNSFWHTAVPSSWRSLPDAFFPYSSCLSTRCLKTSKYSDVASDVTSISPKAPVSQGSACVAREGIFRIKSWASLRILSAFPRAIVFVRIESGPPSHRSRVTRNFSAKPLGRETNISVFFASPKRSQRNLNTSSMVAEAMPSSSTTMEAKLVRSPRTFVKDRRSCFPASSRTVAVTASAETTGWLLPKRQHFRIRNATAFPILRSLCFCDRSFAGIENHRTTASKPPDNINASRNDLASSTSALMHSVLVSGGKVVSASGAGCRKHSITCITYTE